MIKKILTAAGLSLLLSGSGLALASSGGALQDAQTNLRDTASLQRGAMLFMNYCSGCHSLKYLRYSRMAEDLGLTEEEVMANLNFTGAKFGEPIVAAMRPEDGTAWFGKAPPDLSLEVSAKGADWVYSYLHSFYIDPSRPVGWNNTVFPNASMPNVLAPLQGIQKLVETTADDGSTTHDLKLVQAGKLTPAQFDRAVRDLTSFLQYAAEPAALKRTGMGVWVIFYLAFFTFVAYLLKREFWKDVH